MHRYVKDPSLLAGSLAVPSGGAGGRVTGSHGWRRTGSDRVISKSNTPAMASNGNMALPPEIQVTEN